MRRSGVGIKVRKLMVAVVIVALTLAATHVESALSAVIIIVVGCISCLAYKRYSEVLLLRRVSGLTTSRSQKAGMLLASVTIAAVVIGLSDLAFLTGYYGYLRIADGIIWTNHL